MTANQIAAMLFPVLVLVAYGAAAVIVTKVWGRKSIAAPAPREFIIRETARFQAVYDQLSRAEAQRKLQRTS